MNRLAGTTTCLSERTYRHEGTTGACLAYHCFETKSSMRDNWTVDLCDYRISTCSHRKARSDAAHHVCHTSLLALLCAAAAVPPSRKYL